MSKFVTVKLNTFSANMQHLLRHISTSVTFQALPVAFLSQTDQVLGF